MKLIKKIPLSILYRLQKVHDGNSIEIEDLTNALISSTSYII